MAFVVLTSCRCADVSSSQGSAVEFRATELLECV